MCCNVEIEGKELKVENEQESWGSAIFWDGKNKKKVRYRVVLVGVKKRKGGEYAFRSTTIYDYGQPAMKAFKRRLYTKRTKRITTRREEYP